MSRNFETVQRRRGNTPPRPRAYPNPRRRAAAFAVRAALILHPEIDRDGANALLNNQTENIYWPLTMALFNERVPENNNLPRLHPIQQINTIQPIQRPTVVFASDQDHPRETKKELMIRISNRLKESLITDNIDANHCVRLLQDLIELNPFSVLLLDENELIKIKWESTQHEQIVTELINNAMKDMYSWQTTEFNDIGLLQHIFNKVRKSFNDVIIENNYEEMNVIEKDSFGIRNNHHFERVKYMLSDIIGTMMEVNINLSWSPENEIKFKQIITNIIECIYIDSSSFKFKTLLLLLGKMIGITSDERLMTEENYFKTKNDFHYLETPIVSEDEERTYDDELEVNYLDLLDLEADEEHLAAFDAAFARHLAKK